MKALSYLKNEKVLGALDQAVLSGASFFMGAMLLMLAAKEDYGFFSILFSYVALALGLQSALIGMVIASAAGSRPDWREIGVPAEYFQFQFALGMGLSVVSGIVCAINFGGELGFAFAIAMLGNWLREFRRTELISTLRTLDALRADMVYAFAAIGGALAFVTASGQATATVALTCLGIPGIVLSVPSIVRRAREFPGLLHSVRVTLRDGSAITGWAIGGSIVSWLQGSSILSLVGIFAGPASAATVAAGRLFVTPLMVAITGVGRVGLARLVHLSPEARGRQARHMSLVLGLVAGMYGFCATAGAAEDLWGVLPEKYRGITPVVGAWSLVTLALAVRMPGTICEQARGRFADLFRINLAILPIVLIGVTLASWKGLAAWAVVAIAGGELLLGAYLWRRIRS